jgi:dTDP-4-amino-4,6-dideoxygalactose transaminase
MAPYEIWGSSRCTEADSIARRIRQWEQLRDDVTKAMTPVLEAGHFILGEQVSQLESAIATLCGTFFATAGPVSRTGATPVSADIDPLTYNINCEDAERRITPRTRAIVPVHLYGQPADMDSLIELAEAHCLFVVEDGARVTGAHYKGRPVGSMGLPEFLPHEESGLLWRWRYGSHSAAGSSRADSGSARAW